MVRFEVSNTNTEPKVTTKAGSTNTPGFLLNHIQQHRDLKDVRETYLYIGKTPDAKAILTLDSQLEKAGWFLVFTFVDK